MRWFRANQHAEPPARRREPGVPNRTLFITGIGPLAKDPVWKGRGEGAPS